MYMSLVEFTTILLLIGVIVLEAPMVIKMNVYKRSSDDDRKKHNGNSTIAIAQIEATKLWRHQICDFCRLGSCEPK